MSEDEVIVTIVAAILSLILWGVWYYRALVVARMASSSSSRLMLCLTPAVCAAVLWTVLYQWASADVIGVYMMMYMILGAAWVGVFSVFLPWFGLSARDDVVERRNHAAGWSIMGAAVGVTCCFAGGNIGNGPGWWVVLFSAVLATGSLLVLWWLLELAIHPSELITVERDTASGLRLAGLLVAAGLMLGRSVAGDWQSASKTLHDFSQLAWPVPLLFLMAWFLDRALRPTAEAPQRPWLPYGLFPAIVLLSVAAIYLGAVGWWN